MSKSNNAAVYSIVLLISASVFTHKSLVLALPEEELRLHRPDPLRLFKPYNGPYDIRNKHYWASAAFTGIHGYAMAGIWLIAGVGFWTFKLIRSSNRDNSPVTDYPGSSFVVVFSLIAVFTILAIVATGIIMAANKSSQHRSLKLTRTIFDAAAETCQSIRTVTDVLVQMQTILLPYDPNTSKLLNSTSDTLRAESISIKQFVDDTKHPVNQAIEILYVLNLVVATVNLALLIAAIVMLVLHWYPGVLIIIFCCWILTAFCWILTGLDFFFHNFAADTCTALKEFEQHPQNSSLQSILPCGDSSKYDGMLSQIGSTVHNFILQLNAQIAKFQEEFGLGNGKNDTLNFQEICDPFSGAPGYSYSPEKCPNGTISVGDLPNILSGFTCEEEKPTADCLADGKFIPESAYLMVSAYSISVQNLLNVFPDLLNLTQCSSMKEAFSNIVQQQCEPLNRSTKVLWSSMLSLSIIMMVLISFWIAKASLDRGRCFPTFSIIPQPVQESEGSTSQSHPEHIP